MTTVTEQDLWINQNKMIGCMPIGHIRDRVIQYMKNVRSKRNDEDEVGTVFGDPLCGIVEDALTPVLEQSFGQSGRVLARQLGQIAESMGLPNEPGVGFAEGRNTEITNAIDKAETDAAARLLISVWFDTLVLYARPEKVPEGEVQLDAMLFPWQENAGPLRGEVPEWMRIEGREGFQCWRVIFLEAFKSIALTDTSIISTWTAFVYDFKQMIHRSGFDAGFLLDRDQDHEFAIVYREDTDRYYFTWRPIESAEAD